jgi:hypothetical protein
MQKRRKGKAMEVPTVNELPGLRHQQKTLTLAAGTV